MMTWLETSTGQYYVSALIMIWPMMVVFRRAGFRAWWALMLAVPMVGYLLCGGFLTFRSWPTNRIGAA
jgi:hypothetical protein